jgi:hypothetical protein
MDGGQHDRLRAQGGYIIEEWIGLYGTLFGLIIAVFCESMVISWIYGLERFKHDLYEMLGFFPGPYWCFCWAVMSPAFLLVIQLFMTRTFVHLTVQFHHWSMGVFTAGYRRRRAARVVPNHRHVDGHEQRCCHTDDGSVAVVHRARQHVPSGGCVCARTRTHAHSARAQKLQASITPWKDTIDSATLHGTRQLTLSTATDEEKHAAQQRHATAAQSVVLSTAKRTAHAHNLDVML